MGYTPLLRGRVQGLARGVDVPNATPDASGLASVNPIFTFVRLAQRVPVRIHIDEVPDDIKLVAGMTATVQIEPFKAAAALRFEARAWESRPGRRATGFVPDADRRDVAARPCRRRQTGDSNAGPARATRCPPCDASGSAARRGGDFAARDSLKRIVVSTPPSPQAAAAADAAAADLKKLQQQIAAFPPSGAGSAKSDGGMPSSEFLGQTYDLFGGQSATPSPKPRSPDTIRRRARSRWRHLPPRSP